MKSNPLPYTLFDNYWHPIFNKDNDTITTIYAQYRVLWISERLEATNWNLKEVMKLDMKNNL